MRIIFAVFPLIWLVVVGSVVYKIVTNSTHHQPPKKHPPQNRSITDYLKDAPRPAARDFEKPVSRPVHRQGKSLGDKLNGEDQPKRGKLSRESRDDEKDWF